jgi:hypothetical protein
VGVMAWMITSSGNRNAILDRTSVSSQGLSTGGKLFGCV